MGRRYEAQIDSDEDGTELQPTPQPAGEADGAET